MTDKLLNLRHSISEMLVARGQPSEFQENDSLFDSGRLDSMSAVNLLLELESSFGIDLSDPDFNVSSIDTFAEIRRVVSSKV